MDDPGEGEARFRRAVRRSEEVCITRDSASQNDSKYEAANVIVFGNRETYEKAIQEGLVAKTCILANRIEILKNEREVVLFPNMQIITRISANHRRLLQARKAASLIRLTQASTTGPTSSSSSPPR